MKNFYVIFTIKAIYVLIGTIFATKKVLFLLMRYLIVINYQKVYLATVTIIRRKSIFNSVPSSTIDMEHLKNDFDIISSDSSSNSFFTK